MATSSTSGYNICGFHEYSKILHYATYQPSDVGSFSVNNEGDFDNCDKAEFPRLKDLKSPLKINLNEGFDPKIIDIKTPRFPHAEKPLRWIRESKNGYQTLADVDVITQKGVLKKIGHTISNRYKNSWTIETCKYKGKLYLRFPTEDKWYRETEWGMRNCYWGVKFEEHVIEPAPHAKASFKMLKGKIGNKKMLISAEVDAIKTDGTLVEIKTCFEDKLTDQKMCFAWLQSYLGNIDVLYYGWKDKHGVVSRKPQEFKMESIPGSKLLKKPVANAMFGFIGDFIDWLYNALPDEDEIWSLEYTGGGQISFKFHSEKFLPNWYLQFIDSASEDELAKKVEALDLKCAH